MQALWMVLAAFLFALMSICVKYASQYFNAAEIVFYRGLVSMVLIAWLAHRSKVSLRTKYPREHAWRSFVGVTSMGAWFYAIGHLPQRCGLRRAGGHRHHAQFHEQHLDGRVSYRPGLAAAPPDA